MGGTPSKARSRAAENVPAPLWLRHPLLLLAAAVLALYGRTVAFDFSYFDDNELIVQVRNQLRSLAHLPQVFLEDVFHSATRVYYRPLLIVSFMVDSQFGEGAGAYHFTNVLLHLACACLVYAVEAVSAIHGESRFFALLFAVHVLSRGSPGARDKRFSPDRLVLFFSLSSASAHGRTGRICASFRWYPRC